MKRTLLYLLAVLLSVIAGVQTAWGQKITLYMGGKQSHEYDISQLDSIVFSDAPATVDPDEIVVTVDADGNVDGEHSFSRIDEASFLIDDLKYTVQNGDLVVSGYDHVSFTGTARIISKLIYLGRLMNVVGIGDVAFTSCNILISVTIPESVTTIGGSAFSDCTSLPSINIPESVTSIGEGAFSGCSGLTSITVETGNPTYDSRDNCNAIIKTETNTLIVGCQSTTIPSSVTSIGDWAFWNCSSLTSIDIPESVTSIGENVFYYCEGLTSIAIPESVTSIALGTFEYCTGLTTVTIPSSVTSIGRLAFYGCSSLTDVYCYAENVPSVESGAFYESSYSSATLHVPAGSVNAYKAKVPWKNFGSIVAIE